MDIWKHSLLSEHKFGGKAEDYYEIHKFMDSSKLHYFHAKHRMLLHNTYGIELCIRLFGDYIKNSDAETILVRDIAAEHCKEDLSGMVPTLNDWLVKNEHLETLLEVVPEIQDEKLREFIYLPLMLSNNKASLLITCSDFGVQLVKQFLGLDQALVLSQLIPTSQNIKSILKAFKFHAKWQFSPKMDELEKIKHLR
ncbi:DUF6915 family protein [Chondrinema litorale]|uniref:DUF6915 family protein n=1 Tax=Chondrinema litorale TaxID=2994555 RepID=UPI002542DE31|nr:hypothetical protein [Chondrinema litorale]UZR98164.1 hypothetical protein OQ292_29640 [Chondrinema litorale]